MDVATHPSAPTSPRTSSRRLVPGLVGLLVGSAAANSVPHLAHGVTGAAYGTPFGAGSSPAVNLAWGTANLLLAVGITAIGRRWVRSTAFLLGAGAGVLGTGASLLAMSS